MKPSARLAVCAAALTIPCAAQAVNLAQPVSIRADSIQLSQSTGVSTYTGHVRLVQAGMTIHAHYIKVVSAHGHILRMHGYGSPLRMVDAQPGQLPIFGRARRMVYRGTDKELTLIGDVHFRQGPNTLHAHMIHYYTTTQHVVALGRAGQRVRATLVPHTLHHHNRKPAKP